MTPQQFVKHYQQVGSIKAVARKANLSWHSTHDAYTQAVAAGLMDPLSPGRKTREQNIAIVKGTVEVKNVSQKMAEKDAKSQPVIIEGKLRSARAAQAELNFGKDGIARLLFSSAQNNTAIHEKFWTNLLAFKAHVKADLHISQFAYVKKGFGSWGDKHAWLKGEKFQSVRDFWFDPRVVKYASNDVVQIAPGLVWCGDENISPSDANPLSGLQVTTGRASAIVPHTKISMESVASAQAEPTKFLYTTGAVTLKNYISRKAGKKAEFHHCYGALIVEVNRDGDWWCRQINADSEGTIYDRDPKGNALLRVKEGVVTTGHRAEGITWGDSHVDEIDEVVKEVQHGKGGIVDLLRPKFQFFHDVLDFFRRNHHEMKDHFSLMERHVMKKECVREEVQGVGEFLDYARRPFCKSVVVDSNHDRALGRWLVDQDGRRDPVNFKFWSQMNAWVAEQICKDGARGSIFALAMQYVCGDKILKKDLFLREDESFIICHDASGGIECGMHGDRAANGARGGIRALARIGRKKNIGHSHIAGIYDGVYQAGASIKMYPGYVKGPSAWSHSFIVVMPNGKRQIWTIWKGKAHA